MNEKKNYSIFIVIGVIALGFALVIIFLFTELLNRKSNLSDQVREIIYPNGFDFEDLGAKQKIREQNSLSNSYLDTVNDFSLRISSAVLAANDKGDNISFSPLALYYSLASVSSIAEGETQRELLDLIGLQDTGYLDDQSGNLYRRIYFNNEIGKFQMANSFWLSNSINGKPVAFMTDFVRDTAHHFYVSLHSVSFSNPSTANTISAWIDEHTDGIVEIEPTIDPTQIFSIISTFYYSDQWQYEFDAALTRSGIFNLANGHKTDVDFMECIYRTATISRGDGFTRSSLSLKNDGHVFFVLPDEGVSPYDLISTPALFENAITGGKYFFGEVDWQIPKFSFASNLDFKPILKKQGLDKAFTSEADFNSIANLPVFVSNLSQEMKITINEKGVETSIYTQASYGTDIPSNGRIEMILDRPFIFGITIPVSYASKNCFESLNTIVLVGIIENPSVQ